MVSFLFAKYYELCMPYFLEILLYKLLILSKKVYRHFLYVFIERFDVFKENRLSLTNAINCFPLFSTSTFDFAKTLVRNIYDVISSWPSRRIYYRHSEILSDIKVTSLDKNRRYLVDSSMKTNTEKNMYIVLL